FGFVDLPLIRLHEADTLLSTHLPQTLGFGVQLIRKITKPCNHAWIILPNGEAQPPPSAGIRWCGRPSAPATKRPHQSSSSATYPQALPPTKAGDRRASTGVKKPDAPHCPATRQVERDHRQPARNGRTMP